MSLDEFDEVNQDAAVAPKKKMTVEKFFQQFNTLDPNNYGAWPAFGQNYLLDFYYFPDFGFRLFCRNQAKVRCHCSSWDKRATHIPQPLQRGSLSVISEFISDPPIRYTISPLHHKRYYIICRGLV